MNNPQALVLSGDGINCASETAHGLELAGFKAVVSHTSDLLTNPAALAGASLLALPGGFSFGDEIASGKVLAVKIRHKMLDLLHQYIDKGGLVLGICNGFQTLVQLGLLPNSNQADGEDNSTVSLRHNAGGKFINRWVEMSVNQNTPFLSSLQTISLPIRHGEGKIEIKPDAKADEIAFVQNQTALTYHQDVNGSFERIAALTNAKGNVFGLMPHPEAFVRHSQHPAYQAYKHASTDRKAENTIVCFENKFADGLVILKNARFSLN